MKLPLTSPALIASAGEVPFFFFLVGGGSSRGAVLSIH